VPGYYTEAALIAKQARELGLTIPLFGVTMEAPNTGDRRNAVEGCYYSTHYSPEDPAPLSSNSCRRSKRAGAAKCRMRWRARHDPALMLADAIKRAGSTDGARIRDAPGRHKGFAGVTGTTSMDADRNASKAAVIVVIKDGRFQFLGPSRRESRLIPVIEFLQQLLNGLR